MLAAPRFSQAKNYQAATSLPRCCTFDLTDPVMCLADYLERLNEGASA